MAKYTKNTLDKLTEIFARLDYRVRFEKGNFKSGYCILEEKKIVVINRFFDIEGKVRTMIDLLHAIDFDLVALDEDTKKLIEKFVSPLETV